MDAKVEINKLMLMVVGGSAAIKAASMQADLLRDVLPVTHPTFFGIVELAEELEQINALLEAISVGDWAEMLDKN